MPCRVVQSFGLGISGLGIPAASARQTADMAAERNLQPVEHRPEAARGGGAPGVEGGRVEADRVKGGGQRGRGHRGGHRQMRQVHGLAQLARAAVMRDQHARRARREGGQCGEIPLTASGDLDLERVPPASAGQAALVAVTHVNNETGAIADLARFRVWMQEYAPRAVLVVDAAQSFGRQRIPWQTAQIDALVVSARKIGGPAGVAALVVRRGLRLEPVLYGGGQQGNLRSGTVDVVGVVEAGQAARLVAAGREAEAARIGTLNAFLRQRLGAWTCPALRLLSPPGASPWILTFAVPGYEGAILMRLLAERGIVVATGSACSAESGKTSHVLRAMGVPDALARCVLRVSFGRHTTAECLEVFLHGLRQVVDAY